MIAQFKGESRKDAIINHFSLDLEEEEEFFAFMEKMGKTVDDDDEVIENLYKMFS